jgi:hypothetical protein
MMRRIENTTSSTVSGVPSWNLTPWRMSNSISVSLIARQAVAICGAIWPWSSRVSKLS